MGAPQSSLASGAVSHHTLGKRPRDSFETDLEDSGHDKQGSEQDGMPISKKAKISRFDDDLIVDMADDSDNPEPARTLEPSRSRAPAFNIFQEPNDALEGLNEQVGLTRLSDYLIIPSPPATVSAADCGRHDAANATYGRQRYILLAKLYTVFQHFPIPNPHNLPLPAAPEQGVMSPTQMTRSDQICFNHSGCLHLVALHLTCQAR